MSPRRRRPGPTPAEQQEHQEYRDYVAGASWECIHGLTAGSLCRPFAWGPACPLCRRMPRITWRWMSQLPKIPGSVL